MVLTFTFALWIALWLLFMYVIGSLFYALPLPYPLPLVYYYYLTFGSYHTALPLGFVLLCACSSTLHIPC